MFGGRWKFLTKIGQVEVLTAARRNRSKAYTAKIVLDEKGGKVKLDFGVGPAAG